MGCRHSSIAWMTLCCAVVKLIVLLRLFSNLNSNLVYTKKRCLHFLGRIEDFNPKEIRAVGLTYLPFLQVVDQYRLPFFLKKQINFLWIISLFFKKWIANWFPNVLNLLTSQFGSRCLRCWWIIILVFAGKSIWTCWLLITVSWRGVG